MATFIWCFVLMCATAPLWGIDLDWFSLAFAATVSGGMQWWSERR